MQVYTVNPILPVQDALVTCAEGYFSEYHFNEGCVSDGCIGEGCSRLVQPCD